MEKTYRQTEEDIMENVSLFLIIVEEQPYISIKIFETFFKISSVVICRWNKVFQVWNDMKVSTLFF